MLTTDSHGTFHVWQDKPNGIHLGTIRRNQDSLSLWDWTRCNDGVSGTDEIGMALHMLKYVKPYHREHFKTCDCTDCQALERGVPGGYEH